MSGRRRQAVRDAVGSGLSRRAFLAGMAAVPWLADHAGTSGELPRNDRAPATSVRTIRLRPFQELLRGTLRPGAQLEKAAGSLFAMTRLDGFVVDPKNRDVLLFGQVDGRFPTLRLSWLVTAMRNVWLSPSDPGCSIDPLQEDLAAVMRLFSEQRAANAAP